MAQELNLKIITPERVVLDQKAESVTVTAIDGEMSVLPDHEPIITALAIDVVRWKVKGEEEMAAIMGGVMEVKQNEVTILSDTAELDTEIDVARAHQARERAEAEKIQKTDKLDVYISEMAISRAIARVKAVELRQRRKGRHLN
jgi:F-type H+-transporting ATPase subunit epsilon